MHALADKMIKRTLQSVEKSLWERAAHPWADPLAPHDGPSKQTTLFSLVNFCPHSRFMHCYLEKQLPPARFAVREEARPPPKRSSPR